MKVVLKTNIIALLMLLSSGSFSQDNSLPVFKTENAGSSSLCDFNCYIQNSFRSLYSKYFKVACGHYFHTVKFNIDSAGNIKNISFDNPPSNMTRFIEDMLTSTNGKWMRDVSGKTMVLPVFFYFADRCDSNKSISIHYYSTPPAENTNRIAGNGYIIQRVEKDHIVLWPVKLKGNMVFREVFINRSQHTR